MLKLLVILIQLKDIIILQSLKANFFILLMIEREEITLIYHYWYYGMRSFAFQVLGIESPSGRFSL